MTVGASTMRPLAFSIPGYEFTGGVATMHAGVEILVENGGTEPNALIATISGLLDTAPARAVAELGQLRVQARQDEGYDHYYERAYRIPGFQAVAASGGGMSIYFGGKIYAEGVLFHELGHVAARLFDSGSWMRALHADDTHLREVLATGTLTPKQLGPIVPDPVRRARWTPRLSPGGVTGYADQALTAAGTPAEDMCEALKIRTMERYFGDAMATFHDAKTGAERDITFAELYPNRAKLLEALGPAVRDVQHSVS